jgi:FkbM family methyltransferase
MLIQLLLKQYLARKLNVIEIPTALERLNTIGFKPNQIFDVGAYKGEFAQLCLNIWPQAKVACFEALEPQLQKIQQLADKNSAISIFPGLLGAEYCEQVPLNLSETASSVLEEHISQNFAVQYYTMRTIDQIVSQHFSNSPPDFLKIDVQGYELEVLKGAEKTLPKIQVILAEINLLDIHKEVPLIAEIIAWLNERDWVAYDICGLTRRPLDRTLWQADFIFVPRSSSLRADKRWNT